MQDRPYGRCVLSSIIDFFADASLQFYAGLGLAVLLSVFGGE